VDKLNINEDDKKALLKLTPSKYIGLSTTIVDKN
jgi:hypothetical protein